MSDSAWAPVFHPDEEPNLSGAVYQALGAAALCWDNAEAAGVFQTEQATAIAEGLLAFIEAEKKPKPWLLKEKCPNCGAPQRGKSLQEGGGVECSERCGWWFCY